MRQLSSKFALFILFIGLFFTANTLAQSIQFDIAGPAGSGDFGAQVAALPNGNIVVTDPNYGIPAGAANVGAVYLYNGSTGNLISTLTGSTSGDHVGNGGVTVLSNGNYVIVSRNWTNGGATNAGAVTFCDGTTGLSGVVTAANSLVGGSMSDFVGNDGLTTLPNGNYVVKTASWHNGATANAGAVTFGNGTTGISGLVSDSNSLVGSTANDLVGNSGITVLTNGNYVIRSPYWDNGAAADAGAITFGNGTTGVSGAVSSANSLIGGSTGDFLGNAGIAALANGNYAVASQAWDNGATANVGAVTFGNGTSGVSGLVSASNSLIGSTADDQVGDITPLSNGNYVVSSVSWDNGGTANVGAVTFGNGTTGVSGAVSTSNSLVGSSANDVVGRVTALSNGNYVVSSSNWDNGGTQDVGAATFADGTNGITGTVTAANSLIGSTANDQIGSDGVTPLTNGNYVVGSSVWNNGASTFAGAVTFGNGTTGITGVVSAANSLVGSTSDDQVGYIYALTNGNYVVASPNWDNGMATDAGAVTFGNGTSGTSGTVSAANSLVGGATNDQVGSDDIKLLTNGNYVVVSSAWNNGAATGAGAVTFGNGTTGISGVVSSANSLVGAATDDQVGEYGATALTNGNYVVRSPSWDDGGTADVGAVTFGDGTTGVTGVVSSSNSLVGTTIGDTVGIGGITALADGDYVVRSPNFDNGGTNTGAITYLNGLTGNFAPLTGNVRKQIDPKRQMRSSPDFAISMTNSVLGTAANGGNSLNFSYDSTNNQLVVGRPADNIVTLFRLTSKAASVTVAGRVQTLSGSAIPHAIVSIEDQSGQTRTARTNGFGYFRFEDVQVGAGYTVNAFAKGHSFSPQIVNILGAVDDLTLTENP